MTRLDVTTEREDGVAVVVLSGSAIGDQTRRMDDAFAGLLAAGEHDFVIDMTDVWVIDGAGMAALVGLFKRVRIGPGDVRLCGLQTWVTVVFAMTRLNRVFDTYEDRSAAVASFRPATVEAAG